MRVFWLLITVSLLGVLDGKSQTPGKVDSAFQRPMVLASGGITATAIQSDGKVLIGGGFALVNGVVHNGVARLNPDGSLDSGFNPSFGASDSVSAIGVQTDGKIVVGGNFSSVNGVARTNLARLNPDGSLDASFWASIYYEGINALVVQADGKIIIGGGFTLVNGMSRNRVARLNTDGSLDSGFGAGGTGADATVYSLALQADGKVILGGLFSSVSGTARNKVARLTTDGSVDASFNPGNVSGLGPVYSVLAQTDGKIVVGGFFNSINGVTRNNVARLNTDGGLDTGFNVGMGTNDIVYSLAVQADGKIVLGGSFTSVNGVARGRLARLNANGSVDAGFDPGMGADYFVFSLVIQADGKVILGGFFVSVDGITRNGVARVNTNGSLDAPFNLTGATVYGSVNSIALQKDGKIIFGGGFTSVNGVARRGIARLSADGTLDAGFSPSGIDINQTVKSVAVQDDGKIVLGGDFTTINGVARLRIARLNSDGSLDTGFNPDPVYNGDIYTLVVQSDGKIVVGGVFTSINGVARNKIARLNTGGSLDTTFDPGTGSLSSVSDLVAQADGKLVVGGNFSVVNGVGRKNIARLNTDGSVDAGFNPGTGVSASVAALTVQPDGKVIIGGAFTSINGVARNRIARLEANGNLDVGFDPGSGAPNTVSVVATQADGKIVLGGLFTTVNGLARGHVARLNSNGSVDDGFDPGAGANRNVYSLVVQTDGKIVLGGDFSTVDGSAGAGVARLLGGSPRPAITSASSANGQIGASFSYQVSATNTPSSYSSSDLPGGLGIDAATGLISGMPTQTGIFNVGLVATNNGGTGTATLTLAISDTFANWQDSNFTSAELADQAISGPLGDATGAGVSNLVKYALGIPPKRAGGTGLPMAAVQLVAADGGFSSYLMLTYTRNKLASGISLTVQVSGALDDWTSGSTVTTEVSRTDNGNGTETIVTRDNTAVGSGANQRFIRLQVSQP